MSRSIHPFLQHILSETQYLMARSQGLTKAEFLGDETLTVQGRVRRHPQAHGAQ